MRLQKYIIGAAGLCLMASSTIAHAEMLKVSGLFPAEDYAINEVDSIAVEPFEGEEGLRMQIALEKRLERAEVYDEPYFTIQPYRSELTPDATVTGAAYSQIDRYNVKESRERCVERDADNDCVSRKKVTVECLKRTIRFTGNAIIARAEADREAFRKQFSRSKDEVVCDSDEAFGSVESALQSMANKVASEIRFALAPYHRDYDVRILESRKGMEKVDKKIFKAAVKLTKKDELAACDMWQQQADNGLQQISLQFNLGVCAEKKGELAKAMMLYEDAISRFGTKYELREAIDRVGERQLADSQWNARLEYFAQFIDGDEAPAETATESEVDSAS